MIGFGMASFAIGLAGLWLTRKKFMLPQHLRVGEDEVPHLVLFPKKALGPTLAPGSGASRPGPWLPADRQLLGLDLHRDGPSAWVVYGVLQTRDAVSPGVSQGEVLTSMIVFTSLYAILAVVEVKLLAKYIKAGPPELTEDDLNPPTKIGGDTRDADKPMAFSY